MKTLIEAKEEAINTLKSLEKEVSSLTDEKTSILESENSLKLQLLESRKECESIKSEMTSHEKQSNGLAANALQDQLVEIRKECDDAKRSVESAAQEKSELQVEYLNMKKENESLNSSNYSLKENNDNLLIQHQKILDQLSLNAAELSVAKNDHSNVEASSTLLNEELATVQGDIIYSSFLFSFLFP